MELKDLISYTISLTALTLSIVAVWYNNLKPFKIKIVAGEVKICVPFIGDAWLPGVDLPISFCNVGRRHGKIQDIRARVYGKDSKRSYKFTLNAQWIVDPKEFDDVRHKYKEWRKTVVRAWTPFILTGMTTETLHVFLRGHRIETQSLGDFECDLEVFTTEKKKWIVVTTFIFPLNDLAFTGTPFSVPNRELDRIRSLK